MAKVEVRFQQVTLHTDNGRPIPGLCATCTECDHQVEVFGVNPPSKRRACVMLSEECPRDDRNFYSFDDD